MSKIFELVANISIKYNLKFFYKIFYYIFKFFLNKKIILKFKDYKFFAYPNRKEISRTMIRSLKIWDEYIVSLIINQINEKEDIFIDIGCNYGAYSIPISKSKNQINIYSFDASKKSLDKLIENIKLNQVKNIRYFHLGIGEKEKIVKFDDETKNFKNSASYRIKNNGEGTKIKLNSIDNLIKNKIIIANKNIFIKIDIEGYEFYALKGLIETIKNYNVMIFFEFSKKLEENHSNLQFEFNKFITENNLVIKNNNFEDQNIDELFQSLYNLNDDYEVLDNYIITKKTR
tara:strand:- start:315 stop:1178 length:864 start_codon:yes stop_codon:yes gene_type:complete